MPKLKRGKQAGKELQPEESGSITFSTRFTEEQRDRIVAAAETRGWTPSNLMRVATIDRATHILNTSRQTKWDFKSLANKVARQLAAPEAAITDADGNALGPEAMEGVYVFDTVATAERFSLSEIEALKKAAKLGGGEFLELVIDYCESITAPQRRDLPEPIEPA